MPRNMRDIIFSPGNTPIKTLMPITSIDLLPVIGNLPIPCLQDAYNYLQCIWIAVLSRNYSWCNLQKSYISELISEHNGKIVLKAALSIIIGILQAWYRYIAYYRQQVYRSYRHQGFIKVLPIDKMMPIIFIGICSSYYRQNLQMNQNKTKNQNGCCTSCLISQILLWRTHLI